MSVKKHLWSTNLVLIGVIVVRLCSSISNRCFFREPRCFARRRKSCSRLGLKRGREGFNLAKRSKKKLENDVLDMGGGILYGCLGHFMMFFMGCFMVISAIWCLNFRTSRYKRRSKQSQQICWKFFVGVVKHVAQRANARCLPGDGGRYWVRPYVTVWLKVEWERDLWLSRDITSSW